jgi:hypothetical protein
VGKLPNKFASTSDHQDSATQASEFFARDGGSWRDYVLVADIEPPRIIRTSPGIALLDFEDPTLAQACRQFLVEQEAQTFGSFDELKGAFGMHQIRENGMVVYESTAGFYTVEHPADWRISRAESDKNILNILPPEGSGEVTISAFHGGGASPLALRGLIDRVFKNYEVVSPLRAISQNNWDGLQAEFLQSVGAGFRSWLVIGACYRKVLVVITANDTQEAMPLQRHVYESILNSLVLADPEEAKG